MVRASEDNPACRYATYASMQTGTVPCTVILPPAGRRPRPGPGWAGTLALLACLLAGCTGGPGGSFSAFNPTHKLIDPAKAMRLAAPVPAAVPRELDKRPQPPYVVEPGDVLLVQPADVESPAHLPGDQPVMPDGTIQLGKYGRLQVVGKTVEEIEAAVKGAGRGADQGRGRRSRFAW